MFKKLMAIQMRSYGNPVPFEFPVERVHQEEIQKALFFNKKGELVQFTDKHDLKAYLLKKGTVHMVHQLFTKETVYELFLS